MKRIVAAALLAASISVAFAGAPGQLGREILQAFGGPVNARAATSGQVLTRQSDGSWAGATPSSSSSSIVRLGITADVAAFPDNAYTAISWDEELEDTDGWHAGGAPTRMTCPTGAGGVYLLEVALNWQNNTTGYRGIQIRVNGTEVRKVNQLPISGGFRFCTALTIRLAAGDYLEVYGVQTSGGTISIYADAGAINGETLCSLTKLGP